MQQTGGDLSEIAPGPVTPATLAQTILRASWMALALGLLLDGLLLLVAQPAGGVLADTAQKVSWSDLVCVALACGTAVGRVRPATATMGLLGLLAAPVAFGVARLSAVAAKRIG
jgi:hypothetical protein